MRRTLPWIVCLTLLLFPHATVHGQSVKQTTNQAPTQPETSPWLRMLDNGAWWTALSHDKKADFIDGYVTAMKEVRRVLLSFYKKGANELTSTDPEFKANMNGLITLATLAEKYDYEVDKAKLLAGVDEFYKDPPNTRITVELALQHIRDTLNGKNAPRDLEKQLNEWRAIVNK